MGLGNYGAYASHSAKKRTEKIRALARRRKEIIKRSHLRRDGGGSAGLLGEELEAICHKKIRRPLPVIRKRGKIEKGQVLNVAGR